MPTAEFFAAYGQLFLTLHLLGVILGLGGATIADTLFFRFLKDLRISSREAAVLDWISKVVTAALLLIFISGFALYLAEPERFQQSASFTFKMLVVVVLTINGLLLHHFVSPRLVKITFLPSTHGAREQIQYLRKAAFAMGSVSAVSWYSTFFIAMLKSLLPPTVTLNILLGIYTAVLAIAVFSSQMIERWLDRRGSAL